MAECSYARCVQERRAIKKELQRWTKNMVFVVGLERVAEELMGRRKWKQYQDVVLRSPLTVEVDDWEPQDKCCFCDGGTLLGPAPSPTSDSGSSTNSRSSFRETPPVTLSEGHSAAHIPSPSATMTTLESVTSMAASLAAVAAFSVNSNHSTNVNSSSGTIPSGAAAVPFYPPSHHHGSLFPPWYLSPPPPHLPPVRGVLPSSMADGLRMEAVPSAKQDAPIPPMVMSLPASAGTEQPLDLSAKANCPVSGESGTGLCSRIPTPDQSLKVPIVDHKHIYKAKPRMSTVAGRRTYTEEELQAALRDIQSGKLGTRRAAVIYGIPRSTLRNKVYKLAMERERDSHLVLGNNTPITVIPGDKALLSPVTGIKVDDDVKEDEEEEEKELSGAEDEREVEKALRKPLLSMEDLVRFSMLEGGSLAAAESLRTLLQHGKFLDDRRGQSGIEREDGTSPPVFPGFPHSDIWQGLEHSALGPFISQLLAASAGGRRDFAANIGNKNPNGGIPATPGENSPTDIATEFLPKFSSPLLPELARRMMADEEQLRKQRGHSDASFLLNGAHPDETFKSEGKLMRHVELSSSVITHTEATKNEAEEPPDVDAAATSSGLATPPNVILKIPSFKPTSKNGVASGGGSGTSSGSGAPESPFPALGTFPHHSNRSPSAVQESSQQSAICNSTGVATRSNHSDSCSPPITSLVGKGIGVSLRDVIAKSISQKFQQGSDISHLPLSQKLLLAQDGTDQPPYKRGRFTPPLGCNASSVIKHNNNNNHLDDRNAPKATPVHKPVTSSATATNTTGGKGTRPKRGKYRNYDRDSLVEAVRAVQRGEMSVHRAGSYYGVPHSTLEYKVKERHLMRPRKREPKPQLEDSKRKEEANALRNSPADKLKMTSKPPKVPFTPSSPIPNPPNGLKIPPLFDPSMSPLAYATPPPFPFWTHNPFHHSLSMPDFSRGGSASNRFSPSTEQFFASQMMQRLQEESSRIHSNTSPGVSAVRSPPNVGSGGTLGKSAREMAESLYDGTGANGSFLDGIIRSSLDMGLPAGAPKENNNATPENMSNKALLDQLCRNSHLPPLTQATVPVHENSSSDDDCHNQSSVSAYGKTESDASTPAPVDLVPTNGSTESDKKVTVHIEEEEEDVKSPRANTKEMLSAEDETKSFSKETNGLSNANDPTDDVSACDSKTNLMRVGDIDAAKDLTEEERSEDPATQEDTKSKKINS